MPFDLLAEQALIEVSRMQREALSAVPQPWWDEQMKLVTAMAELQQIADDNGWEA